MRREAKRRGVHDGVCGEVRVVDGVKTLDRRETGATKAGVIVECGVDETLGNDEDRDGDV